MTITENVSLLNSLVSYCLQTLNKHRSAMGSWGLMLSFIPFDWNSNNERF